MSPRLLVVPSLLALFGLAVSSSRSPRTPYLAELHLHGPLSEGTASVAAHTGEGVRLGYDLLWWTDHRRRMSADFYRTAVDFEGSLQTPTDYPRIDDPVLNEFVLTEQVAGSTALDFSDQDPFAGREHGSLRLASAPTDGWIRASLTLRNERKLERIGLLAEPRPHLAVRLQELYPSASGFSIRVQLSSRADGSTAAGVPNVLEYVPAGMSVPPPGPGVVRMPLPALTVGDWTSLVLDPAADASAFEEGIDQSFSGLEILLAARAGAAVALDLDDFRVRLDGPTDWKLLERFEERLVEGGYTSAIAHEVGMEIGGPDGQDLPCEATNSDHLVALFPGGAPAALRAMQDRPLGQEDAPYPAGAVQRIQGYGGVAILAHLFGTGFPPQRKSAADAQVLSDRVVANAAWGADAMEVGYPDRERPLADFLATWDALSAQRTYVTGVGSSDDHNVLPWDLNPNHWGSWIRSTGPSSQELVDAVRGGQVFFGDPKRVAPEADLEFQALDGSFTMGDVVPSAPESVGFRVHASGLELGSVLAVLVSGVEVTQLPAKGTEVDTSFTADVLPGAWVRLEVRSAEGETYLVGNPIYFVEETAAPPPARTPGP